MPSEDFEKFEYNYFTGPWMIRARHEEDVSVWKKFKGEELEKAKQMILDVLPSDHTCYMLAASITRDERAIEKLKFTAQHSSNLFARTFAAKILFNWVGFEGYLELLDKVYEEGDQYSKSSLISWITGLNEEAVLKYFWKAFNDRDSYVRYCAYEALERYYGINRIRHDGAEIHYYTSDSIYANPELFEQRKEELEIIIKTWKNPEIVKVLNSTLPYRTYFPKTEDIPIKQVVVDKAEIDDTPKYIKPHFALLSIFFAISSIYFQIKWISIINPYHSFSDYYGVFPWTKTAVLASIACLTSIIISTIRGETTNWIRKVGIGLCLLLSLLWVWFVFKAKGII